MLPVTSPRIFTENDWNEASIQEVETLGTAAASGSMYRASKTLAERAAWKFVENNRDKLNWDLTVINPPFVFGPVLHEVAKPEALNTSMLEWYNVAVKGTKTDEELVQTG